MELRNGRIVGENDSFFEAIEADSNFQALFQDLVFDSDSDPEVIQRTQANHSRQNMKTYLAHPYGGNINPVNADDKKLYIAATKERDNNEKINVIQENAKEFREMVITDSAKFGWGSLVHRVECAGGKVFSIIRDIRKVTLKHVMLQAYKLGRYVSNSKFRLANY